MARKLQLKRGLKKDLPQLAEGEPGFVTDEKVLYIGTQNGNQKVGDTVIADGITGKKYRWGVENGIAYLEEVE